MASSFSSSFFASTGHSVQTTDGRQGVVRYIGETLFAAGQWVGLEFPTAEGKNDGSVKGHRYFTCPPNHGMFVKMSAVKKVVKPALSPIAIPSASPTSSPEPSPTLSERTRASLEQLAPQYGFGFGAKAKGKTSVRKSSPPNRPSAITKSTSSFTKPDTASKRVSSPIEPDTTAKRTSSSNKTDAQRVSPPAVPDPTGQVNEMRARIAALETTCATLESNYAAAEAAKDRFEKIVHKLETKVKSGKEEQADLLRKNQELSKQLETALSDVSGKESMLETVIMQKEESLAKVKELEEKVDHLKGDIESLQLDKGILEEQNMALNGGWVPEHEVQMYPENTDTDKLKEALISVREAVEDKQRQLTNETTSLQADSREFSTVKQERDELKAKLSKAENELAKAEDRISEIRLQLDASLASEEILEKLEAEKSALQSEVLRLQATVTELSALNEANDQLEIEHIRNANELERLLEQTREHLAKHEQKAKEQAAVISEHEQTIAQFRALIMEPVKGSESFSTPDAKERERTSIVIADLEQRLQAETQLSRFKAMEHESRILKVQEELRNLKAQLSAQAEELRQARLLSKDAASEIERLNQEAREHKTQLLLSEQSLEESRMKIALLEKRAKVTDEKAKQTQALEDDMITLRAKIAGLVQEVDQRKEQAAELEAEKDRLRQLIPEGGSTVQGEANRTVSHLTREIQEMKSNIELMEAANAFYRRAASRRSLEEEKEAILEAPVTRRPDSGVWGLDIEIADAFSPVELSPVLLKLDL